MQYVNHENVIGADLDAAPSAKNPGGGVQSKVWNIQRAFPNMKIAHELGDVINFIDPMWINVNNTGESHERKLEELENSKAINILWQEELAMFRLTFNNLGKGQIINDYRFKFYKKMDYIVNCNRYLNDMMKAYINSPMRILYTPIDDELFKPATKKKQIVAMGRICHQKNTKDVIQMFQALPDSIEKIYIGSADLWGKPPKLDEERQQKCDEWQQAVDQQQHEYEQNIELQKQIKEVCDWKPALNKLQVAKILSESWAYLNMSRYDTGCLSFIESALSGCYCFCWENHPMFDEYGFVNRFRGIKDGANLIAELSEKHLDMNISLRNQMVAKHGYEAVREQLKSIVGDILV